MKDRIVTKLNTALIVAVEICGLVIKNLEFTQQSSKPYGFA